MDNKDFLQNIPPQSAPGLPLNSTKSIKAHELGEHYNKRIADYVQVDF